jgi:hypothetical protein
VVITGTTSINEFVNDKSLSIVYIGTMRTVNYQSLLWAARAGHYRRRLSGRAPSGGDGSGYW